MLPSSGKICSSVWTRVLIQLCIFCGLYFDCIQIQSFSGHFNFLHLSTLPRSDFPGSQGAKKHHRLVLFRWAGAKFLVFYVFFLWRMQTLQRTRKRLETELTNITRLHFCSLRFLCIERSFIYFIYFLFVSEFFPLFVCFDILWENATTHATGTQIVRAKMRSLDANFAGETSRALALSFAFATENIRHLLLALRAREKKLSSSCRQV